MSVTIQCVSVDCRDLAAVAGFWAEALGWPITHESDDEWAIEPPGSTRTAASPDLLFIRVPEAKSVKNRLHLDLRPDDQDGEVERLLGLGARRVDIGQGDQTWVVMADPEGNEFCVLRALSAEETAAG